MNADETGFQLCPKNKKVLAPRGTKNVYEIEHASPKTIITVMFTFSAAGTTVPLMVEFTGKRPKGEIKKSVPAD